MVLIGLIAQFGLPVVMQLLGRAGVAMTPENQRLASNGLSLLVDAAKTLASRPKTCWYDGKVTCCFEAAPLCGMGLEMAKTGKELVDVTLRDLEGCRWRSDMKKGG